MMNRRRTHALLLGALLLMAIAAPLVHAVVTPTAESIFVYDGTVGSSLYKGAALTVGQVIDAYDPSGTHCGTYTVTTAGQVGSFPVYKDDSATAGVDEGADVGDVISFTIDGDAATVTSCSAGAACSGGDVVWNANGGTADVILDVPDIALEFSTEPDGSVSGAVLTTQPVVRALSNGALDATFTGVVTLSKATGAGTVGGTLTATAVAGVATFTDVKYTAAVDGETFTLNADATGYTQVVNPTAVTADVVATVLEFSTQPAGSVSGAALTTQPAVQGVDGDGTLDTGFTGTVALTASAGTLGGTTSMAAVAGVATFTNVAITATADGESATLTAAATGVTSAVSSAVASDVVATKLVWATQPASAFNATAMLTQPVVEGQDAANVLDTGFTGNVVIAATAGTGTLSGTTTMAAVAGVATFTDIQYDVLADGDAFTLDATSAGLTAAGGVALTGSILPAPTLTAVPAAAVGTQENHAPLLTWSTVPVAASYVLDFGTAPACDDIENDLAVAGTSYQSAELADGSYCWRVRSVGGTGNLSPWSADSTFDTIPTFGEWGMIFLVLSMVGGGAWYLRRKGHVA